MTEFGAILNAILRDATDGYPVEVEAAADCARLNMEWSTAATPFRIASLTKPFVALAVHRLIRSGGIRLRTTLDQLASGETIELLRDAGYDPGSIEVGHLLSHTSGIFDHSSHPAYREMVLADPTRTWSRLEQIALAARLGAPYGAPGKVYRYSDTGYIVLGEIVERLASEDLATAVRRLAGLDELGLSRTWWEGAEAPRAEPLAAQIADGIDVSRIDPSFDTYGGGGLVSDVADLVRFMRALTGGALLTRPELAGALAVPPATPATDGGPQWRTHGFLLSTMRFGNFWVLGQTGQWGSVMLYCAELDSALAVTLNHSDAGSTDALSRVCADLLQAIADQLGGAG